MRRQPLVTTALALALAGATLIAPAEAKPKAPPAAEHVTFTQWDFGDGHQDGTFSGTSDASGALVMTAPGGPDRRYTDPYATTPVEKAYDESTWTSSSVSTPFGLTELVASWNAHTPGGSWIETSVQGVADDGTTSKWYVLGRWADRDETSIHATSLGGQGDALATVSIDTLVALNEHTFDSYRIKVSLLRPDGSTVTPSVDMVGAMASNVPDVKKHTAPPTTMTETSVLDVPTYSQEVHIGDYPEYDNGGEAWCSPTSTSMVLAYWGKGTAPADYGWVTAEHPGHPDPWVDNAARRTFDHNYDGAGNWPFNTAYAGTYDLEGFVTRLRDLNEAERFIRAGIPVVTSVSFKKGALDGAGYGTNGHLMTIVGFTQDGDVVVNDPASHLVPSDDEVRVTYDRQQFTDAWIGHTGGIAYVIHPESVPLPARTAEANW